MGLSVSLNFLEYMRNEYVSMIIHIALNITRKPEYEIIGDKSSGRGDFAIRV